MRLDSRGREYWRATFTSDTAITTADVQLGGEWHPGTVEGDEVVVLVAGPAATGNPAGTVVLPLGRSVVRVRFADTSEAVVREAGVITVTA